jgi:alkanesulfonate monooxygenase SsuD/methylene tetrahydromethanopterin reductase-like flavin-dependent oxidoreductase (luciferase family)
MKFGFTSLGDLSSDPATSTTPSASERLEEIVQAAELTEQLGLDSFGVGEHHSGRWVLTAPPVVLASIAARTERIRLRTAVTLIPNLDPVRVAEDYATVDVLSGGRLELTVGKGNFPQPWSLFGQDHDEQRDRLAEGTDLLRQIWREDPITWEGRFRPPLVEASIGPRPLQTPPPIWWAASTAPSSVEFAAERGMPLVVAGVFRELEHCGELVDHYREVAASHGHDPASLPVAFASHLYVGRDGAAAKRDFEQYYRHALGAATGEMHDPMPPLDYEQRLRGPLICGSPAEAAEKILAIHDRIRHDLHVFHCDLGGIPWRVLRPSLELFAEEVVPAVDAALSTTAAAA